MKKICVLLVCVVIVDKAFSTDLRGKRQTEDADDDLDNRYGWNWQPAFGRGQPQWTMQYPNPRFQGQWLYPRQYPDQSIFFGQGQFPGQGQLPGQVQFPGQGQFSGQGQFPNQGFPGQGQFPGQGRFNGQGQFNNGQGQIFGEGRLPGQGQQTTQNPIDGSTTSAENNPTVQECIRNCPVTAEYNPVCGSNGVTYPNPGRLMCAQGCGVTVNLLRSSPCPSTTTVAPSLS